jgi:SAM-dependent methyltransferase
MFKAEYYDKIYSTSDKYKCHYSRSPYKNIWESAMKYIEGDVMDLGCGTGQFANMLRDNNHKGKYIGIDFSGEAIDIARKVNPTMSFVCLDLNDVPWFSGTIVMFEVLEHIEDDIAVIKKIEKGSKVIFSVPDYMSDNHYRKFDNMEEVRDRYKMINIKWYQKWAFRKDCPEEEYNHIFLCYGKKR